jgi:hypothetical protein
LMHRVAYGLHRYPALAVYAVGLVPELFPRSNKC